MQNSISKENVVEFTSKTTTESRSGASIPTELTNLDIWCLIIYSLKNNGSCIFSIIICQGRETANIAAHSILHLLQKTPDRCSSSMGLGSECWNWVDTPRRHRGRGLI